MTSIVSLLCAETEEGLVYSGLIFSASATPNQLESLRLLAIYVALGQIVGSTVSAMRG